MRPANEAILVIDVQLDFCPGGALAVAGGDEIVAPVNALVPEFPVRVFTQDWHPGDHSSFASQHEGSEPYSMIDGQGCLKCIRQFPAVFPSQFSGKICNRLIDAEDFVLRQK